MAFVLRFPSPHSRYMGHTRSRDTCSSRSLKNGPTTSSFLLTRAMLLGIYWPQTNSIFLIPRLKYTLWMGKTFRAGPLKDFPGARSMELCFLFMHYLYPWPWLVTEIRKVNTLKKHFVNVSIELWLTYFLGWLSNYRNEKLCDVKETLRKVWAIKRLPWAIERPPWSILVDIR